MPNGISPFPFRLEPVKKHGNKKHRSSGELQSEMINRKEDHLLIIDLGPADSVIRKDPIIV
jgi:hypothetical protein